MLEIFEGLKKMKHIVKIITLLMAITTVWVGLLQTSMIPSSHTWSLSAHVFVFLYLLVEFILCNTYNALFPPFIQLLVYCIVSLGCYGLLMVGVGLMQFPTCPREALLLQQDIIEAKGYLKQRGIDVSVS
ncbi:dolichol-phosphate mannose synthase subunit 3-like isoform X1 [Prosopis cineraria]|uniref:dolichol-phosphate mannose synthase subunit 3-like isoform X1 n=1 Tax=Prosopis cineraria TaxID=364024 RepID=UPI00240F66A3|nr:dolichol-phosphate mannose synthase subunit 3-like isoform X1 [Prosopis cineraria]